ncbi:flavin-containing monooxygenase [Pseudonocardia sp. Cha107L01]|uniref:flavin-containing monooxygenase n=1 Tax=Pseudonocardia sp. Cha107L01 TaxID=3457576 RepID=UPI00403ED72A
MSRAEAPPATKPRVRSPRVAIVGAGMSGLGLAMRLVKAGLHDFTIFEKADDLGGTWHHNSYPGLACDVPARFYTYLDEPNPDWSQFFPGGAEIWRYFDGVARRYRLRPHIRFGAKVTAATWTGSSWTVRTEAGDQGRFDFLVTATGILHTPKLPAIDGLDSFAGPVLHSARWDHTVDLAGKRVGVIGNGSTGVQIISALAPEAARLAVFLRTPQWILPVPNWRYSTLSRAVIGRSRRLGRLGYRLYQRIFELTFGEATTHPGWQRSVMSALCRWHLGRVRDPELRARLTPDFEPMCKRIVMGLGFYRAVQRRNVDLVTDPITSVVPDGVVTEGGTTHRLDALVLATGFDAQAYLRPMALTGAGGVTLDELWADDPFAYRSVALPGFPNYFMLVGPHSPFGNFSVISIAEAQADYVMQCLELYATGRLEALAPRRDATERYNAELVKAMPGTIWTSGCTSWYLDKHGRPNTFPGTPAEHRALLTEPELAHFEVSTPVVQPSVQR